jgi:hypothetical protein
MAKKPQPILLDHLGREIELNSPVAFFHRGMKCMKTGRVIKISRVNVRVSWTGTYGDSDRSVPARDVILLEEDAYAYHCLRTVA